MYMRQDYQEHFYTLNNISFCLVRDLNDVINALMNAHSLISAPPQ